MAQSFKSAFAAARKAGKKEFTWNGKKYHTRTKDEEMKTTGGTRPKPRPASSTTRPKARPKAPTRPKASPKGGKASVTGRKPSEARNPRQGKSVVSKAAAGISNLRRKTKEENKKARKTRSDRSM